MHGHDQVRTDYSTASTRTARPVEQPSAGTGWAVGITLGALALFGAFGIVLAGPIPHADTTGFTTALVFAAAVVGWASRRLDDTHVSLAAVATLVLVGVLDPEDLFETGGSEAMWLLAAAFVLAAAINRTGLPTRLALDLVGRARSPRQLAHLITAGLLISALLVPSTSGRAALVLPVYVALARAFADRARLVRALAVLFPTVVLLSAIASLVGAGAHLITSELLDETADAGIGFVQWLVWGVPFAVVSSHIATELVLLLFTRRTDRARRLRVGMADLRAGAGQPERMSRNEVRAGCLLLLVVGFWCTEELHGFAPAFVAWAGALLITSPGVGTVRLDAALKEVPWSLLLFMAATTALGTALTSSGATDLLVAGLFGDAGTLLVAVVALSVAAHLLVQSRSARSSVLIPLVIPAAIGAGMNPVALAFASTAAAGFCHTLPSSAKPVALFADVDGVPTYGRRDLVRLSALLGPVLAVLVLVFATIFWPLLGLPLH